MQYIIPSDGRESNREDFDQSVSMVFSRNANRVEGRLVGSKGRPCGTESETALDQKHEA